MSLINLVQEKTPKLLTDTLEQLSIQAEIVRRQKETLEIFPEHKIPSRKVFLDHKEAHRIVILKAMTILEETKRNSKIFDLQSQRVGGETIKEKIIALEENIAKNVTEIMRLETTFFLKQKEVIFVA